MPPFMFYTIPPLDGLVLIKIKNAHQGVLRTRKGLLHEIISNLSAQGVDKAREILVYSAL
jgi:hypothetical protein